MRDTSARRRAAADGQARAGRRAARPQARRHDLSCARRTSSTPIRTSSRSGWSIGPRPRPIASSSPSAPPTAHGARSPTRRRWRRCARIAQALLERNLSPERPIAILSGNDIEHALLGARRDDDRHSLCADLGGLLADVERLRQAQVDHRDRSRRAWSLPPTARRSRARSRRRCRATPRSSSRPIRRRAGRATLFADLLAREADRRRSTPRTPRSGPTRSPSSCSPRARPASPRA